MQDPYYPRDYYQSGAKTIPFDGDGSISAFRVAGGRCAFKQRYVLTERYVAERRAGRAVFGILKTPFSHHPCVRAVQDNTANTNVVVHAGRLLALSEQGPPYELDPNTMTTLGNTPFPGQLPKGAPYTAHPHVDPTTGELVGYGFFDVSIAIGNAFPFLLNYVKFKIDPQAETDQLDDPEVLVDVPCEFPRTDERFLMRKSRYTFMDCFDPAAVTDPALLYRGLNCLARYDHQRKKLEVMSPGPGCLVQEPCFSARGPDAAEGDGFLITLVDNVPRERNEIVIQDTRDFQTVVARVILPFRLRSAVHGNWVDAERIPATGPFIAPLPDLYTHPAAA
ncbi:putative carotenoid oxygenase protein [Neofusicoccum parvum UCRNP2]|uniref:Putative carotenoid oxygenase protein n=1 Tax=Botryosphaeria parva (strain UCR-NP2) TaxID=1287680 RepID=R1E7M1_BOTPV|nr:putative carotenoid oxygenase protein [Neofusicoccum parvum UCRNP2]